MRRATLSLGIALAASGLGCGASPSPGPAEVEPAQSASAALATPPSSVTAAATQAAPAAEAAPPAPPPIPKGTAVLLVGDSFALAGFTQALKPRMKDLGVRYEVRAETSSFTTTWAGKMEILVANTQPDLVILVLGANEMSNIEPVTHAPAVKRIVEGIKGRPCVWVTPPLWKKDTGMMDVIREYSAPCRFFDSDLFIKEPLPRQADKVHPTDAGGAIWADAFWAWLDRERAPADGSNASPWRLKPSPPDEHTPHVK
jgi:hypothetical protein